MADAIYPKFLEYILNALLTGDVKACLVDTGSYTYSSAHQYMNLDTVPAAAQIALTGNLSGKSVTSGVFDADNETFSAVTGNQSEAIILFLDGGDGGVSQSGTNDLVICYIDGATGLPVTPNGSDITIDWSTGENKIFKV